MSTPDTPDAPDRRDAPDAGDPLDALLAELFDAAAAAEPGATGVIGASDAGGRADARLEHLLAADIDQLVADILSDSATDPALAGVRAGAGLAERQLVLVAGDLDVVLDVAHDAQSGRLRLSGQVPEAAEPLAVQLVDGDTEVALATTDEVGEFVLADVPPGRYLLVLAGARSEATVELELEAGAGSG